MPRDTEYNQSDVAYETKGDKDSGDPSCGTKSQFPGDKMPQGNTWKKGSVKSKYNLHRYREHR